MELLICQRNWLGLPLLLCLAGCNSPYHADRGALFGGLTGAGVGALVGHAAGNTGAGAAIGAGVGALTGAAIGSEMDQVEARNRAMIEQKLGRQIAAGAVTVGEVVSMHQAGVAEELVINHVRAHGMAAPLQTSDLIWLQEQKIPTPIITAMQQSPPKPVQASATTAPVVVQEYYYDPYYDPWGPRVYYRHCPPPRHHHPPPGVSWGVTVH
mgnify:CR=1 FL=1